MVKPSRRVFSGVAVGSAQETIPKSPAVTSRLRIVSLAVKPRASRSIGASVPANPP